MNIEAEELLARIRRDYPMPYQLSQQQLIIDKQYEEIQQLRAELVVARESNSSKATGSAPVPAETQYGENHRAYVRPPTPSNPTPHEQR